MSTASTVYETRDKLDTATTSAQTIVQVPLGQAVDGAKDSVRTYEIDWVGHSLDGRTSYVWATMRLRLYSSGNAWALNNTAPEVGDQWNQGGGLATAYAVSVVDASDAAATLHARVTPIVSSLCRWAATIRRVV